MISSKEKTVTYTLKLDYFEARWLATLMQNPIFEDEYEEDSKMREKFFEALKASILP
jgi:hypothetical protein